MRVLGTTLAVCVCVLMGGATAFAQESGIRVRSVRVLANDPEAIATFYKKAFGMSETRRVGAAPGFLEVIINSGSTPELAKKAAGAAVVIATRPKDAPAGAMASLILEVPDLNKAIEAAKANGGTLMRPPGKSGDLMFAFLKDPDGNQVELVMSPK
jgi:predicted enzyme related to lactoylglutathione lyase